MMGCTKYNNTSTNQGSGKYFKRIQRLSMFVAQASFRDEIWWFIWLESVEVFAENKLGVICRTVDSFNIKSRQNVTVLHNILIGNELLNKNI